MRPKFNSCHWIPWDSCIIFGGVGNKWFFPFKQIQMVSVTYNPKNLSVSSLITCSPNHLFAMFDSSCTWVGNVTALTNRVWQKWHYVTWVRSIKRIASALSSWGAYSGGSQLPCKKSNYPETAMLETMVDMPGDSPRWASSWQPASAASHMCIIWELDLQPQLSLQMIAAQPTTEGNCLWDQNSWLAKSWEKQTGCCVRSLSLGVVYFTTNNPEPISWFGLFDSHRTCRGYTRGRCEFSLF